MDSIVLDNYDLGSNLPFLDKVTKQVVESQFESVLDEVDYLESFQSSFRQALGWIQPWLPSWMNYVGD